MLKSIQSFFQQHILPVQNESPQDDVEALHLATATLLFEMAQMDDHIDNREREAIQRLLADKFRLDSALSAQLLALGADKSRQASCMQEFTRLLNENFSHAEKRQMVKMLWQVAYSDGIIDKYEDLFVRQIADLLYVPHQDFIQLKHEVVDGLP